MKQVILLSGKMRSGKNVSAKFLAEYFKSIGKTVEEQSFAYELKKYCEEKFTKLTDMINIFHDEGHALHTTHENWYEDKNIITRSILQIVGTDIIRNLDINYWLYIVKLKIIESKSDVIILTDVRFENEIKLHFLTEPIMCTKIRINRTSKVNYEGMMHISETALDEYTDWDYVIQNETSLENLKHKCYEIAKKIIKTDGFSLARDLL